MEDTPHGLTHKLNAVRVSAFAITGVICAAIWFEIARAALSLL